MDIPKFIPYHTNAYLENAFATPPATTKQPVKPTSGASKLYFSSLIICVIQILAYSLISRA